MIDKVRKISHAAWASAVDVWCGIPPEPFAAERAVLSDAEALLDAYRRKKKLNRRDAMDSLMFEFMHLCQCEPRYGSFDKSLAKAKQSFQDYDLDTD